MDEASRYNLLTMDNLGMEITKLIEYDCAVVR